MMTSKLRGMTGSLFARQVGTTTLSRGAVALVSMASAAITTRWLGPEGKGLVALALLVPSTLALLLGLGRAPANVYLAASRQEPIRALAANASAFGLLGAIVGACTVLGLHLSGLLSRLVPGVGWVYIVVGMATLPIGLLTSDLSAILQGLRRIGALNVLNLLRSVLNVVFLCILVIWMRMGAMGAVVSGVACSFVMLLAVAWQARRIGAVFRPALESRVVSSTLHYGLRAYVGNLLQFFNYRLDLFIVNAFLGPSDVGIYGVAVVFAELLWQLPNATAYVIFPKSAESCKEVMNRFTPRVCATVFGVTATGALGLVVFGKWAIVFVCSTRFIEAYAPMVALLPGVVLLGVSKILSNDIAGRGYPQYNSIIAGVSLVPTIALNVLLIPEMGVLGASLASTLSYSLSFLLTVAVYVNVSRRRAIAPARCALDDGGREEAPGGGGSQRKT